MIVTGQKRSMINKVLKSQIGKMNVTNIGREGF